jgi:hypothetical protein
MPKFFVVVSGYSGNGHLEVSKRDIQTALEAYVSEKKETLVGVLVETRTMSSGFDVYVIGFSRERDVSNSIAERQISGPELRDILVAHTFSSGKKFLGVSVRQLE